MKYFAFIVIGVIAIFGAAIYFGMRAEKVLDQSAANERKLRVQSAHEATEERRALEKEMTKMGRDDNDTDVSEQKKMSSEALNKLQDVQQGGGSFDAANPQMFLDFCLGKSMMSARASCLQSASTKHPKNARIFFHLGDTYCSLGERDKAMNAYNHLVKINGSLANELLQTISRM